MTYLMIDTDSVLATGARVIAASEGAPTGSGAVISPAATDPVSSAVAATLQARTATIDSYSAAGAAIAAARGQQLGASATTYDEQEATNAATLRSGGSQGSAPIPIPAIPGSVALPPVPLVTPPTPAAPPGGGEAISELIHGGPGTAALHAASRKLHDHAGELRSVGDRLIAHAGDVATSWSSDSGLTAAQRVSQLGAWFHQHSEHTQAAASAIRSHAERFERLKANVPTPSQFTDVKNQLRQAAAANAAARGRYAPVIATLQTKLGAMNAQAVSQYSSYSADAYSPAVAGATINPPPQPGGGVNLTGISPEGPATSPDDRIVGPSAGPHIQMVDDHNEPPPAPPQTGEPIKRPQTPTPPTVINANIDPGPPPSAAPEAPPKCDAGDVLVHLGEVVGGGVTAGAAVPAEIPSMGASTGLFIAGAAGIAAGVNGIRECAGK